MVEKPRRAPRNGMRRAWTAVAVPLLVLGAACGQIGGTHQAPVGPVAAGPVGGGSSPVGYADSGALHGIDPNVQSFGGVSITWKQTMLGRV